MKKIAILGAGAFGFAMAKVIGENQTEKEIYIYDVNCDFIAHIEETRKHPLFHGQTELPEHIKTTIDIEEAVSNTDLIILAIPSKCLRAGIRSFKEYLKDGVTFVNLAKGLEAKTNLRVSQVISEELADLNIKYNACCLSGGMIAREVTLENPLCAELACNCRDCAKKIGKMLWSDYLRIETTDDLIGVELAGALKNVIAIGAGIFDGLGYGESSKSAFVSATAKQMRGLALKMGAREETFGPGSQAWFGDLMTTCFGASRNREFGELIGKGIKAEDARKAMIANNKSVEGFITTKVVFDLVKEHGVEAPLLKEIYEVLYEEKEPKAFVNNFIKAW